MTPLAPLAVSEINFGIDEKVEHQIQRMVDDFRVKQEARRRFDAEERGHILPPTIETLQTRLARPRVATKWRITNWQPEGSREILAAQFKAGKATLVGNVIRSLVDGDPFLGRDSATAVDGAVALLDFEMSEGQLDDWLRSQQIQRGDAVIAIPMRGCTASFNILDKEVRSWAGDATVCLKDRFGAALSSLLGIELPEPIVEL